MINPKINEYLEVLNDSYPNLYTESFCAKDGKEYLIYSSNYYDRVKDEESTNELENEIKVLKISDFCDDNVLCNVVSRLDSEMYQKADVAYLGLISLLNGKYSRLGLGSKMLQVFEESALNHGIKHLSGLFCPLDDNIADTSEVLKFYKKNGYGLCQDVQKLTEENYMLLYKNFDNCNQPIKPQVLYEKTNDYFKTIYPLLDNYNRKVIESLYM